MGKRLPKPGDRREWKGGYARFSDRAGGFVYYLYRKGQIEKSTGVVDDEQLAEAHFEHWQRVKAGYDPRDVKMGGTPLYFDQALVEAYCQHLASRALNPCSPHHVARNRALLGWWLGKIGGRNLRALDLADLTKACPDDGTVSAFRMKRVTIKALVNWLHKEGQLKRDEGPEVDRLHAPQSRGLKLNVPGVDPAILAQREHKGENAAKAYRMVRLELPEHWRNVLDLLADTGWHVSEVQRWIRHGYIVEPMPAGREHEGAGYLVTVHKNGGTHRTIVNAEGLKVALAFKAWNEQQRKTVLEVPAKLRDASGAVVGFEMVERKRSEFPYQHFLKIVRRAVERINREHKAGKRPEGCPENFGPGHLRHAVFTSAIYAGATMAEAASFVGHKDTAMGAKHYADPQAQAHAAKKLAQVIPLPQKAGGLL